MSGIHLKSNPVEQQLESLRALVEELRAENAELRREFGYWQSMHARASERNTKQQSKLEESKAEIRQLKLVRKRKSSQPAIVQIGSMIQRSGTQQRPENLCRANLA